MRLIDADAVIDRYYAYWEYHCINMGEDDRQWLRRCIDDAPTIDAEPVKHGVWLPQILLGERVWDCSECKTLGSPHWKRCPVCEAKMDGERKKI